MCIRDRGNTVRWVHIIEDSEVPDFLHGNELIFTTGIGHVGNEWLKIFTVSLKNKGAIGLVVNIGPYISSVPSQAIVFCEQNGFPLFTIPWKTRIIDISYEFCRRIIANEKRESTICLLYTSVSVPGSVISALVSEYFAEYIIGVGRQIRENILIAQYSTAWAYIITACIIGILMYAVLMIIESVLLRKRR